MRWKDALKVGLAQCLSLVPGTSRSGATIMGGMLFGLSRQAATEFSFFLAVPIMFAATGYQVVKYRHLFEAADLGPFAVGFAVSFVAALVGRARAHPLRREPRLPGVRLVPDRAGRGGARVLRLGLGRRGRLPATARSPCSAR